MSIITKYSTMLNDEMHEKLDLSNSKAVDVSKFIKKSLKLFPAEKYYYVQERNLERQNLYVIPKYGYEFNAQLIGKNIIRSVLKGACEIIGEKNVGFEVPSFKIIKKEIVNTKTKNFIDKFRKDFEACEIFSLVAYGASQYHYMIAIDGENGSYAVSPAFNHNDFMVDACVYDKNIKSVSVCDGKDLMNKLSSKFGIEYRSILPTKKYFGSNVIDDTFSLAEDGKVTLSSVPKAAAKIKIAEAVEI